MAKGKQRHMQASRPQMKYALWMIFCLGSALFGESAPSAVSVNPASGSGAGAAFSFVFSDADGFTDIADPPVLGYESACAPL